MSKSTIEYRGKRVYVGIDVHKKTYSITALVHGEPLHRLTMNSDANGLVEYLKARFAGARIESAYEAGFSGLGLHRRLVARGIHNRVVNPASIEIAANDRVKTDQRDSKKIAEQLAAGRLTANHIPDESQELRRVLTRTREQLVVQRRRVGNQIKSKLHYFGLFEKGIVDDKPIANRDLKRIEEARLPTELAICLKLLIEQWRLLTHQLYQLRTQLRKQAKADAGLEIVYRSVPGVGELSARVLANELGNLAERFSNERQLFRFTGLTPTEHSSGDQVRRGHICRQGAGRIRGILVECAWRAVALDRGFKKTFLRIAKTRGKKRAIVAIARKLVGVIRACFRTETLYQTA